MSQGSTMILEPPAVTRRGRSRNSRAVPQSRTPAPTAEIAGVMVGTFAGFNPAGVPLVKFLADSAMEPATARSIVPLKSTDAGRELVLMFEAGDSRLPIVMGFVMPSAPGAVEVAEPVPAIDARVDGQRVVLEVWQSQHHADSRRQSADPRGICPDPIVGSKPNQRRIRANQLSAQGSPCS
jgi:hypothetical protein